MIVSVRIQNPYVYAMASAAEAARTVVHEAGNVLDAGELARLAGVRAGQTLARAERLFPQALFRCWEKAIGEGAISRIAGQLYAITPWIEAPAYGCFLMRVHQPARVVAEPMVVLAGACVGAAEDRQTAELAALRAAPGHLLVVGAARRLAFLDGFSVNLLCGELSPQTLDMARWCGFDTLGKLLRLSQSQLQAQFGADGGFLFRRLHPVKADRTVAHWQLPAMETATIELGYPELRSDLVNALAHGLCERLAEWDESRAVGRVVIAQAGAPPGKEIICTKPLPKPDRLVRLLQRHLPQVLPPQADAWMLQLTVYYVSALGGTSANLFRRPEVDAALARINTRFPNRMFRFSLHPHAVFPEDVIFKTPA